MNPGDCYWVDLTGVGNHLCIVLCVSSCGEFAWITTFSSWTPAKDQACVVEPGESSALHRRSVVMFRFARRVGVGWISRYGKRVQSVDEALWSRIAHAAMTSDEIPLGCREAMEEQGLFGDP